MRNFFKNPGFTLIEMLIATGISAIVLTTAFGTIGSVYFSQKRIRGAQDFYAESRFLMERVVQISRNNTIDYDRFFEEVGPDSTACSQFLADQAPGEINLDNNKTERMNLGYESIFYWDTNSDGTQDRNLGGYDQGNKIDSGNEKDDDPCTVAFYEPGDVLYLINGARTLRTAIKEEAEQIMVQRQLGADTDDDGKADLWSFETRWDDDGSGICEIEDPENSGPWYKILDDASSEELCARTHDWTAISPKAIEVEGFIFKPSPDRDPFLNFRVDSAQIHPHVFLLIKTKLSNPGRFGFKTTEEPQLLLQTAASSRIFGNTRQ